MDCKGRVGPGKCKCQPLDSLEKGQLNFFRIMLDTMIQEKRLMIPPKFVRKYGDELSAVATLSVANGRVWRVGLAKVENNIFFHDGWHEFVEYYSIRQGISDFHVFIFDMTACEINYPFNGSISEQKPNDDKQNPVLYEDEMEDDVSIEILGFTTPLKNKVLNKSSRKRSMNKWNNPSSKQDSPQSTASMDSSKNRNGYETGSKKFKMEEEVEIIDLDSVNKSSQGKISKNEMSSSHGLSLDKTKGNNKHPNKNAENLQAPVHDSVIQISRSKFKIIHSCGDIHAQFNEGEHTKTAAEVGSSNKITKPCEHELLSESEDDMEIFVSEQFSTMYTKTSQERESAIHAAKFFKPKNPSFMIILRPYSLRKFTLCVPSAFANKYLSRDSECLTLQDSDKREWPVKIGWRLGHGPDLRKGWYKFPGTMI